MRFPTIARILIAIILIFCLVGISSAVVTQYNLTVGSDTVNLFNGTGTATWTAPAGVYVVQYFVLGGAGGGGGVLSAAVQWAAGGGGAGGILNGTGFAVIPGTTYNITVGQGGTGGAATGAVGNVGADSAFANITATTGGIISKGGGGGGYTGAGTSGGSGGGGGVSASPGAGAAGNMWQGSSGGNAAWNTQYRGGGGAGKSADGSTGVVSGNGGAGLLSMITGSVVYYGGGGGGGAYYSAAINGTGGIGGGGHGSRNMTNGTAGMDGLGGGGGGASGQNGVAEAGFAGGSGTVILRYNPSATDFVVIFDNPGTYTWTAPGSITDPIDFLIIGGGGSGGFCTGDTCGAGGGGAGGVIAGSISVVPGAVYNITVGSYGISYTVNHQGGNGTNSSFGNLSPNFVAIGGGGGGGCPAPPAGAAGGSGGGGVTTNVAGSGVSGQGQKGGAGKNSGNYGGGGGGGNISVGVDAPSGGGAGGMGFNSSITGTLKDYAGGGGGGTWNGGTPGAGGVGGGGAGGTSSVGSGGNATKGTGSGGGGTSPLLATPLWAGTGSPGVVILAYTFDTTPRTDFTADVTSGISPLPVTFTSTTSNFIPTDWNWTFGDGNYSAVENPVFTYNIAGTYTVILDASNVSVNATKTKTGYITITAPAVPTPDFAANITSGKKPLIVQFTDLSVNHSYNPMAWDYSFGDGAGNSTDKNPLRTFPNAGSYDINLIATNDMGSGNIKKPLYINVSEFIGFTRQDLELSRGYNLTVYIRDEETRNLILDGSVELSGTLTGLFNATGGTYTTTSDYGVLVVRASAPGYYGDIATYVMDQDRSDTIYLAPIPESGNMNTWYTPHQVRFTVINQYGAPVQNATVSANAINATIPDIWLQTMYGINPNAANDMLNGTLIMQGTTSTDGAIVFTMHGSIRYNINVIDPATGALFATSVMPIGADYPIRTSPYAFPQVSNSTYSKIANTSLTFSEPNSSYVTLGLIYQDTSGSTTSLKFYVTAVHNRTVVYSQDLGNPGTAVRYANFTLRNERGYQYIWNYTAVRT